MPTRALRRGATVFGSAIPSSAPIYVDSDDNKLKYIPAGSGTTEVEIVDASATQTLTNKTLTNPTITAGTTTVTTTNSITAAMSGQTIFLNSATGFVTTLPAPTAGATYTIINILANTSGNHTVVTASSANIIKGNQNSVAGDAGDNGTADDTISFVANNSLAGDKVELFSDGTSWFAYAISRVAAGVTFTQAN